jgi:hypothetical protein
LRCSNYNLSAIVAAVFCSQRARGATLTCHLVPKILTIKEWVHFFGPLCTYCRRPSRCSGNSQNMYSEGALFEYRPKHRVTWFCSWFSSVPPVKCLDTISFRSQPSLFKSFSIHYSSVIPLTLCNLKYSVVTQTTKMESQLVLLFALYQRNSHVKRVTVLPLFRRQRKTNMSSWGNIHIVCIHHCQHQFWGTINCPFFLAFRSCRNLKLCVVIGVKNVQQSAQLFVI